MSVKAFFLMLLLVFVCFFAVCLFSFSHLIRFVHALFPYQALATALVVGLHDLGERMGYVRRVRVRGWGGLNELEAPPVPTLLLTRTTTTGGRRRRGRAEALYRSIGPL